MVILRPVQAAAESKSNPLFCRGEWSMNVWKRLLIGLFLLAVIAKAQTLPNTQIYTYSAVGGYAPNGNLNNYMDSVTGQWSMQYDGLNRLQGASATSGPYNSAVISWQYDSFGNRLNQQLVSGSPTANVPSTWATYDTGNHMTTNQNAVTPGILSYDNGGNMTNDATRQYWYDAENHVCAMFNSLTGQITQYLYDAEGHRVAKGHPAVNSNTLYCPTGPSDFIPDETYVVGQNGEQVTELDGSGNWKHSNVYAGGQLIATYDQEGSQQLLHFNVTDPLGTKRVQTTATGVVEQTCLSLPFGDAPPCTGATEHFFTGKERDTESGNDYFGARYYASSVGRWLSPDPSPAGLMLTNPQSWNLYNYVLNNPLRLVDGNGMWATDVHAQIVTYSLQNYASSGELNSLRARQYSMDADQSDQNDHAMANKGQPSQDALSAMWGIVSNDMSAVAVGKNSDGTLDNFGLYNLGGAMHTLEDFTSPMHTNSSFMPMEWDGGYWPPSGWGPGLRHVSGEEAPYQDWSRIGFAVRLTMAAWLQSGAPCEKGKQCLTEQNFYSEVEKNITSYVNNTYHGSQGSPIQEDMARQCALGNPAACN
jgi:RHS repeat-associated protein